MTCSVPDPLFSFRSLTCSFCNHVTLLTLLAALTVPAGANGATNGLDRSEQCVVVLTEDWVSTTGTLRRFERNGANSGWKQLRRDIAVVLGRKGLGEGRGLVHLSFNNPPRKSEGDDRAPAGIFKLSSAFGYAPKHSAAWIKLPYLTLSPETEGVDDPNSHYYNRLVDRSKVARVDWRSSEQMRRDDDRYKWGIVVEHNPDAVPGAGSCIFLHVWKDSSILTSGCTAMAESDLVKLLRWLDPARRPILVQMPRAVYRSIQSKYDLPPEG